MPTSNENLSLINRIPASMSEELQAEIAAALESDFNEELRVAIEETKAELALVPLDDENFHTKKPEVDLHEQEISNLFERNKNAIWLEMWAYLLQLNVLCEREDLLTNKDSLARWWFLDLKVNVNPGQESFIIHGEPLNGPISPENPIGPITRNNMRWTDVSSIMASIEAGSVARNQEIQRREKLKAKEDK